MSLTLYDAFVPNCQQVLGAMQHLIDRGESHARENGLEDAELIGAKLADDMWPLPWHVRSCWVHSAYVIEQLPTGEFSPDFTDIADSWDGMRAQINAAQEALAEVTPDQLDAVADKTVAFVIGGKRLMEFTGQNFLMSFSQPNVYFHSTTFYDILRMKGVPLGKREFMGHMRIIPS